MSLEIYQEKIIEHYNNPVNYGSISNADISVKDYNLPCGDEIEIQLKIEGNKIKEIKFQGNGCVISQASADILLDLVKNKPIEYSEIITPEEFLKILGIKLSPLRMRCALLGLKVLKTAAYTYNQSK